MSLLRPKLWALRNPVNQLFVRALRISRTKSCQNPVIPAIPGLFNPNFLDELIPWNPPSKRNDPATPSPGKPNPMMDALQQFSHRTRTQNAASAYDSTSSATLDAFNQLTRFSWGERVGELLDKTQAWVEDPDATLKIIWNLRSIHDGKSEKEAFYRAFGWLYDNHPRTAITNLHLLVEPVCLKPGHEPEAGRAHGYWKDLLNILVLATVDELSNISKPARFLHNRPDHRQPRLGGREPHRKRSAHLDDSDIKIELKATVKTKRGVIGVAYQRRLEERLADPKYRALYIAVARLFAQRLLTDWRFLLDAEAAETPDVRKDLLRNISLASKWAPTLRGSHDRRTNIATAISRLFYHQAKDFVPTFSCPSALENHPSLESAEAVDIMRSFFRRWLLTPLRAASVVTESLMAANRWTEIPYNRVSSVCMKNNKERFFMHDPEGFQKYLISVENGKRTISGGDPTTARDRCGKLMKHRRELADMNLRVLEAQWKTLVQNLRDAGTLDNAIAVCDVSGSMGSIDSKYNPKAIEPIFPAVSLSLLLAQLAKPPFNGGFITFSSTPEFVRLDAASLYDNLEKINRSNWNINTDLNAVFLRLILPLAIQNKIKQEDMIRRVFVFSDMQFDQCAVAPNAWETNHDVIQREFKAAGYEVPEVVYWNLSSYNTVEVLADRKGVAMMSGFSPSMLKVFMGEEVMEPEPEVEGSDSEPAEKKAKEEFNPLNVMLKALSRPSFDGLVVVD
ncbi:hypothetical protein MSAN_00311200 [Mycena sanguinolenta]|uniref:Uncharacterized protein n=1 Tax=Mycena sanguinolenta TaxID=230812 RepID=A0A8H6ZB03_9AGAR|nr:hypothetical protein MSAN_00311200 [Mycena sanguinolenta]